MSPRRTSPRRSLPAAAWPRIIASGVIAYLLSAALFAAPATSSGFETAWLTEPACVASSELPARVTALLGGATAPVRLELGSIREPGGWAISLGIHSRGRAFERTIRGPDCETLTEAVALVTAVQVDAMSVADRLPAASPEGGPPPQRPAGMEGAAPEPPAEAVVDTPTGTATDEPSTAAGTDPPRQRPTRAKSEPSEAGPQSSAPVAEEPELSPDESPPPGRARPGVRLGAGIAAELGALPRAAAALELVAGVAWPHARLELGGLSSFGASARSQRVPSVEARFRIMTALVRGCGVLTRRRFELPLCGALEAGAIRAVPTGLTRARLARGPWLAITLGARPQWVPVPRLAVGAWLELAVPWIRHRYEFGRPGTGEPHEVLYQVRRFIGRFGIRLEVRLG